MQALARCCETGEATENFSAETSEPSGIFGKQDWPTEPDVGRAGSWGYPIGLDCLRGLGNAVVPQIAQWIRERIKRA